jgi:hypothetical protein
MTTNARVLTANSISTTSSGIIESDIAYVYDVILDESNEYSKKQNLNQTNNVILYKSILKQGQALKIDVSFTKAYLPIIVE